MQRVTPLSIKFIVFPAQGFAFIHNDFKYNNLMFSQDNKLSVIAILDWEMATLGDPLMDLGTTLAYWIQE